MGLDSSSCVVPPFMKVGGPTSVLQLRVLLDSMTTSQSVEFLVLSSPVFLSPCTPVPKVLMGSRGKVGVIVPDSMTPWGVIWREHLPEVGPLPSMCLGNLL